MEGDFIKIYDWLRPLSWLYGLGVGFRNQLFELGILRSRSFSVPVISVGNITVGGSGKTPHVEYLIRLLQDKAKVAVLSRGYKRKSRGYLLAEDDTPMRLIGDEPYQMKRKFPKIHVAVDKKRCEGIDRLTSDEATCDTDVVLLDDELVVLLQCIREHFGKPVHITSGYRTAEHNAAVGGSKSSQHLLGRAADFYVEGVDVAAVAAYAETLLPGKGGIGRYPPRKGRACGWVHLDTRSTKARWTG